MGQVARYNGIVPHVSPPMQIIRTGSAAAIALVLAGCVSVSATPSPTGAPTGIVQLPSFSETTTPSPDVALTPTPMMVQGPVIRSVDTSSDRYPEDLKNRVFSVEFSMPDELLVGRVGMPERLAFPGSTHLLGVDGDRVTTMTQTTSGWTLDAWSFATAERLAGPVDISNQYEPDRAIGDAVLVAAKGDTTNDLDGLALVSMVDGSIATLVKPKAANPSVSEERAYTVSADGQLLATSVCATGTDSVGDCQAATIIDTDTAKVVHTVAVDGGQVVGVSSAGVLLSWETRAQLRDFRGKVLWSTKPFGAGEALWVLQQFDSSSVFGLLYSYDYGGRTRALVIDAQSGAVRGEASWGAGPPAGVNLDFSTPARLAVRSNDANGCFSDGNDTCDPGESADLDLSVLNVATGAITEHAIHITVAP